MPVCVNKQRLLQTHLQQIKAWIIFDVKIVIMGLLNQNKKGKDQKKGAGPKNAAQGSKFIASKSTKAAGGPKKPMTGGSQRGS